jgi:hypothetical protein
VDPQFRTDLIRYGFSLSIGILATLYGIGYIGRVASPELNPGYERWRNRLRFCGPFMIAGSLLPIVGTYVHQILFPRPLEWQDFYVPEFEFVGLMPGRPVESSQEISTEHGKTAEHMAKVVLPDVDVTCAIHYSRLPSEFPDLSADPTSALLDELVANLATTLNGRLIEQTELPQQFGRGRDFRIEVPGGNIYHARLFFRNRTQYLFAIVTPGHLVDSPLATRFLESFQEVKLAK